MKRENEKFLKKERIKRKLGQFAKPMVFLLLLVLGIVYRKRLTQDFKDFKKEYIKVALKNWIIGLGVMFICNIIAPFVGLAMLIFIFKILTSGLSTTMSNDNNLFMVLVIYYLVYLFSYILPKISELILSPKVFDILYNKIDINLFKKCVGYKEY